jgi:hypothetical protein
MDTLTDEIKNAIRNRLWYAALLLVLALPDVCAALESKNGLSSRDLYRAWYDTWLKRKYEMVSADDLYFLRCGVVHTAKFAHRAMKYKRIFFTLRPNGMFFHKNVLNDALNLDLVWFCKDMVESVKEWFARKKTDPQVQANLANLFQYHPNGLLPYLEGVPAVG